MARSISDIQAAIAADLTPITGASQAELAAMKARMISVWEQLPVAVRVAFRPLKTAVLDAMNNNSFDEVQLLITNAQVAPEFVSAKNALLMLCS